MLTCVDLVIPGDLSGEVRTNAGITIQQRRLPVIVALTHTKLESYVGQVRLHRNNQHRKLPRSQSPAHQNADDHCTHKYSICSAAKWLDIDIDINSRKISNSVHYYGMYTVTSAMVGFCIRVDYNRQRRKSDSVIFTKSAPSTLTQITTLPCSKSTLNFILLIMSPHSPTTPLQECTGL
jgi:hypothetical protein